MTITLYELAPSPHARKVRLLAAELDIPLEKVPLDPRIGETRSPDYLAKNPNGRIPIAEALVLIGLFAASLMAMRSRGVRSEKSLLMSVTAL